MRHLFTTIVLAFIISFTNAQSNEVAKLKDSLSKSKYDTTKVLVTLQLCDYYIFSKLDSALIYAQEALNLSKQSTFQRGEARSLTRIGNILKSAGNFPKALETHLDALKIYEKINDQIGVAASYNNMAEVLKEQHDYRQALNYYFKTQAIFETIIKNARVSKKNNTTIDREQEIKYKRYLATTLLNIGDTYDRMNLLDSSLVFQNQALEIAYMINDKEILGAILSNLGSIWLKKGDIELALSFFRSGVPIMAGINDQQFLSNTYHGMAQAYERKQLHDSSIHYGKLALTSAEKGSFQKEMLNADTLLSRLFESEKMFDSALYYTKLGKNIADSISNEEEIRQVQNLHINEQLRQQDIALANEKEKKDRRDNLQMFAIAVFIVTFFIVLLIISRRKTKPRVLEYLGLVGLLLLFEFITVFLHPYIGKFTDHIPVYVLLISVGVALLLTPLHHRLTNWVKLKLAKKHKKGHSKKTSTVRKHPSHKEKNTPTV